jgi:hypothetical protein
MYTIYTVILIIYLSYVAVNAAKIKTQNLNSNININGFFWYVNMIDTTDY